MERSEWLKTLKVGDVVISKQESAYTGQIYINKKDLVEELL